MKEIKKTDKLTWCIIQLPSGWYIGKLFVNGFSVYVSKSQMCRANAVLAVRRKVNRLNNAWFTKFNFSELEIEE